MKITKSNLKEYISTRNTKTTLLINIFTKWLYHFIVDLYEDSTTTREFQKKLFNIPSWSSHTQDKEFKKFLKMTFKKFNLIEDQLSDIFQEILILNVKILAKTDMEIEIPHFNKFWYKLLKYTGKYFYEHPKDLEINEKTNIKYITKLVQDTILKYIPIKDLFDIKKVEKFEYNFDEVNSNDHNTNNSNLILNKHQNQIENEEGSKGSSKSSSGSLKYISSEQFKNEYYNPDIRNENDENNDKEIPLPKFTKIKLL